MNRQRFTVVLDVDVFGADDLSNDDVRKALSVDLNYVEYAVLDVSVENVCSVPTTKPKVAAPPPRAHGEKP